MITTDKIKNSIIEKISLAFKEAQEAGALPAGEDPAAIEKIAKLETPKDKSHGDVACNIAMVLAKQLKTAPRKIGEEIASRIKKDGYIAVSYTHLVPIFA